MIKNICVPWTNYGARLEYVEYVPNIRKIMNIGNLGGRYSRINITYYDGAFRKSCALST